MNFAQCVALLLFSIGFGGAVIAISGGEGVGYAVKMALIADLVVIVFLVSAAAIVWLTGKIF